MCGKHLAHGASYLFFTNTGKMGIITQVSLLFGGTCTQLASCRLDVAKTDVWSSCHCLNIFGICCQHLKMRGDFDREV